MLAFAEALQAAMAGMESPVSQAVGQADHGYMVPEPDDVSGSGTMYPWSA